MPGTGWDEDGIANDDGALFAVDFHGAAAFEDEVEFFAELVVVAFGRLADGDGGFGEALILHGGIRAVEDAANGAAILGGEGNLFGKRVDRHGEGLFFMFGGSKGKLAGRKDAGQMTSTWTSCPRLCIYHE